MRFISYRPDKKVFLSGLLMFIFYWTSLPAQITSEDLQIGKPCPDFTLDNVNYYAQKKVTLNDFKGKWLTLDFWGNGCASCFESFPKVNQLRKDFKGKLEFLLIGYTDKTIRKVYEQYRRKLNLDLPVAFDTVMFSRFKVPSIPHLVWVDDKGVIRAVTSTGDLNAANIHAMLDGKGISLPKKLNADEEAAKGKGVDWNKLLLANGNGGGDEQFLFRSLLTQWTPDIPYHISMTALNDELDKGRVQVGGMNLDWLYRTAYTGFGYYTPLDAAYYKYALKPVLELKDSSAYVSDGKGKNMYCYSLSVPKEKATFKFMQQVMQRDLQNYFPFEVKLEERMVPCWKLVATDAAKKKIAAKGGTLVNNSTHAGIEVKNMDMKNFLFLIWKYHQDELFIDDTGIQGNIDLAADAIMTDVESIRAALQKHGLNLVRAEWPMKVIVVRGVK